MFNKKGIKFGTKWKISGALTTWAPKIATHLVFSNDIFIKLYPKYVAIWQSLVGCTVYYIWIAQKICTHKTSSKLIMHENNNLQSQIDFHASNLIIYDPGPRQFESCL